MAMTDYEKESLDLLTKIEKRLAAIEKVLKDAEQEKREGNEYLAGINAKPDFSL